MVVGGFWAVKAGRQSVEMAHVEWWSNGRCGEWVTLSGRDRNPGSSLKPNLRRGPLKVGGGRPPHAFYSQNEIWYSRRGGRMPCAIIGFGG